MGVTIHSSSVVSSKAQLGENVDIGPFCIVNDGAKIGDNTKLFASNFVDSGVTIGSDCRLFPGAVVGTEPQDLKFTGEMTLTQIGNRTTLREYSTVHRGTHATGVTKVGDDCLIMAYSHIAHDCRVGSNVVMANVAQIAGHVHLEDWVILGGMSKVHQYCTIGCHSMIGADVKIVMDVPPYVLIGRDPARVEKVNKVGLRRRGIEESVVKEIQDFYDTVLFSGLNNNDGINKFLKRPSISPEVQHCIDFIRNSTRGIHR